MEHISQQQSVMLRAGLLVLLTLQLLMLMALYTRTPPHPPLAVAPFALGPFISASIAIAVAALLGGSGKTARMLALAACLTALVSYGPQKYFDAAFGEIWPAVLLAQAAILAIVYSAIAKPGEAAA